MSVPSIAQGSKSARRPWLAVIAVGLATFCVVTKEMLPVGLLTTISHSFDTSTGTAGLMISLPALLAALFAPLVVVASGDMDRRKILFGLLGLLVIANVACALAPNIGSMLVARVAIGFCMGGVWAIAGGLASRLVPSHHVGLATSIIFGGVASASVLGVPVGALIGDLAGWRWAFGAMALFSALVLALHIALVPALPAAASISVRHFGQQLGNRKLQIGLVLTLLLVAGHFAAFTFVRPLLLSVSGFDPQWIGGLLFAYGIAGIAGNFLAGTVAARRTVLTLMAITWGLLLTPLLFLMIGDRTVGAALVLLGWGLAYGGVSVGLMTWMMKAAPHVVEISTALYVGVFNIGIALGAWAGGQVVDGFGPTASLWVASGFAALALLLTSVIALAQHRTKGALRMTCSPAK